jgi:hypothetical protein
MGAEIKVIHVKYLEQVLNTWLFSFLSSLTTSSVVEYLPSMCEALGFVSPQNKTKQNKKIGLCKNGCVLFISGISIEPLLGFASVGEMWSNSAFTN